MKTFFVLAQNYHASVFPDSRFTFRKNYNMFQNFKGLTPYLSKLSLRKAGVKLIIYDLQGREVTTLVNDELRPGTYEADWDRSNYSSGVYFYKIITADFVETKKMVLIK
ncbi:MAG: T9SS type A sorting domain-containing protein [Ignavibacteria bacterium]|nr:T9SS type A sorting domain-containing protein [Ignavibacteria bacterium]